jgi:hypothetical protein
VFSAPEERRLRARGVAYLQHNPNLYDQWVIKFKAELPNTAPGPWVECRYDAVYTMAYAYLAAGAVAKPTGTLLAEAVLKLNPPGLDFVVGSEDLQDATNVLIAGGDIDIDGVYSNLDFNPATGRITNDAVVFCIDSNQEWHDTEQVWRGSQAAMEGTFECP